MKSNFIITILLTFIFGVVLSQNAEAQFGKLKNKLKSKAKVGNKTTTTKSTSSTSTSKVAGSGLEGKIGAEKIAEMKAYYKTKYYAVRNFPYEVSDEGLHISYCYKGLDILTDFETADWPNLKKRIEEEKGKWPALFKYYGIEDTKGRYADMPYGGQTSSSPIKNSSDLKSINSYLMSIYEWRAKIKKNPRGMAMTVQNLINGAEQAQEVKKFDCARNAIKMAQAIKELDPENPMIDDMLKDAQSNYTQYLTVIEHLMTGKTHKNHLKELVVFNKKQNIGSENEGDITTTINAGEYAFLTGYFAATNKDAGGVPTLNWVMVTENTPPGKAAEKYQADQYQAIYRNGKIEAEVEKAAYMSFELFPEVSSLNYKSHLQYIPHLNFAKWVSMQMPGTYQMIFRWGKTNVIATSKVITLNITKEGRDKAKAYYQELMKKKIATVTFPGACSDMRAKVTNASDLNKYGTLLKVTMTKTGDIMKPWPRDNEIDWNTANGWGAFEKDGKVEVINLEFRKKPTATNWKWWSIGKLPSDYEMTGKMNIKPEKLFFGYEMKKEKVSGCDNW